MKSTFLTTLTVLLFFSFNIKAQNDTKAQNLISEVLSKVKAYDNIQVEFSYILENTQEKLKQETRGSLSLKDEKYLLNLMGTTQLFDGEKIYTIIPEDEEITISNYNPENDNQLTPSKMLTFFEEGYIYKNDILQNKDMSRDTQIITSII